METLSSYVKAPWQTELRRVEIASTPPAGEVLLRVAACGMCGSDLTTAAEGAREWKAWGHEVAGVVEAVGPGERRLNVGDTVVLETGSFCGECALCRNGRVDLCKKAPGMWGRAAMGFSERVVVPTKCVVPYTGLSPAAACLAEPVGVAIDMVKTAGIELGDHVAVVGPGPIALMAVPLALRAGAAKVVCIGQSHHTVRLEAARKLGAVPVVADEPLDTRADLKGAFQRVLLTSPARTIPPALSLLAYGGNLTYIGIGTGSGEITLDANAFHFRKLQLRASFASPAMYFPLALAFLAAGILPAEVLISHRLPLAEMAEALDLCRRRKGETVKVVIEP